MTSTLTHTIWSGPPSRKFRPEDVGAPHVWRIAIPYRWVTKRWELNNSEEAQRLARDLDAMTREVARTSNLLEDVRAERERVRGDLHARLEEQHATINRLVEERDTLTRITKSHREQAEHDEAEIDRLETIVRDVAGAIEKDAAKFGKLASEARALLA